MVSTRSLLIATLVAAAAALTAAAVTGTHSVDHADRAATTRSSQSAVITSPPPTTIRRDVPARSHSPQQPSTASNPAPPAHFRLTVTMGAQTISTNVAPISVASGQPVDPPHATAAQWNTAAWVEESTYPSAHSAGTTYVYGHACHHHVCPFTSLRDAAVGDQVGITTSRGALIYRIDQIGLSPKSASSLPSWAADSTVGNRVVLVTCAYEQGDTSTHNIVVVAHLI